MEENEKPRETSTHNTSIHKRVLELFIPRQQLPMQKGCILHVMKECQMGGIALRKVFESK